MGKVVRGMRHSGRRENKPVRPSSMSLKSEKALGRIGGDVIQNAVTCQHTVNISVVAPLIHRLKCLDKVNLS